MKYREIKKSISKLWRLAFFIFILSFGVHSQIYAAEQDGKITLSFSDIPLREALSRIEKVSDYTFFYDEKNVNVNQKVRLDVKDANMQSLMTALLKDTNLDFEISNRQIVLLSKRSSGSKTAKRHISGVVKDEKGETVIGASVVVEGTTTGTATDIDGRYALDVPVGAKLKITYVGYRPFSVEIKDQTTVDVTLEEDNKVLSEVVVTALGIKREKKMLGYAVQELKSEDLNKTGDPSVTSALQGKVAGLQMNTSSTGLNGSTKITIRGNSSLSDNNQPLWVVDGVPFSDMNNSTASEYGGFDRGGASVDINPDDIESISVLKGPNAAALYGSRAGNGVILITTKRGTKSAGWGVSYSGSCTWTQVAETLDMQDVYGQGEGGVADVSKSGSWGSLLDGHEFIAWNGEIRNYKKYGDPLKDYFRTGFSQNHNVSFGTVTEKSNYRASFGYVKSSGVFHQEQLQKYNADLKAGTDFNKYLSMDSKISLSRTKADNRPYFGKYGEIAQLLMIPNNVSLDDLKHYRTETSEHVNWFGPSNTDLNPYYINNQRDNYDDRWRAFGYYNLKLNFTSWLHFSGKYMFDYYRTQLFDSDRTDYTKEVLADEMNLRENNFFEQNVELMLTGSNKVGDRVQLGYSLGANFMDMRSEGLLGTARNMRKKDDWVLNSALGFNASEQAFERKRVNSLFATFQFAWDDYLSVDLTARNDWSSTLPSDNRSYFYPSVNVSYVISDFVRKMDASLPSWLNFAKLRLSFAQVGKDTDPYQLYNRFVYHQTPNGPEAAAVDVLENANLKPEIATSYEAGLDMRFFDNRLGFDFTYYYSDTKNQVMKVPMSGAYAWKRINAGNIVNKGLELMIYSTPVKTKDFVFDLGVNLAHNRSTVKELADGVSRMDFDNSEKLLVNVGAFSGGKLGDIFPRKSYARDIEGRIIVGEDGLPLVNSEKNPKAIGNIQPDLLMSVSPSFTYKNFTLSALFDMKFGGDIVSVTEAMATFYGTAKRTAKRTDIIVDGVTVSGEKNTKPVSAEDYYKLIGSTDGFAEEFIYDASYIKLKELALSYSFPKTLLKKTPFTNLRLSLVARNLCYLLKHTPGTSPEGGYDTNMYSSAIDYLAVPYTRTFGFSVNVSF